MDDTTKINLFDGPIKLTKGFKPKDEMKYRKILNSSPKNRKAIKKLQKHPFNVATYLQCGMVAEKINARNYANIDGKLQIPTGELENLCNEHGVTVANFWQFFEMLELMDSLEKDGAWD